jgi:hypothetical protein
MEHKHFTERGTHTTVIEPATGVLSALKKNILDIQFSPGKIKANAGAKSSSIKLKHINNEVYEMVIVHNGSRQEFKVFTLASPDEIKKILQKNKTTRNWNCNYTDMRGVQAKTPNNTEDLDAKYKV